MSNQSTLSSKSLLDNRKWKVGDYLKDKITDGSILKFVSAYFTIYGFGAMKDALFKTTEVNFLYGDPSGLQSQDPQNNQTKSFKLTKESTLTLREQLYQKHLAKECIEWVSQSNVSIRSMKTSNFLHGKMYSVSHLNDESHRYGIVGSSNFTQSGLGFSKNSNIEINHAFTGNDCTDLEQWFESLWNDQNETLDVKQEVIKALGRIGAEQSPAFIYYKTLFEIFKDRLEERERAKVDAEELQFTNKKIYKKLYQFQKDGVSEVIRKLNTYNGCILADSVGLGKTFSALAVIKYYELNNYKVLVLCPKKLRSNWDIYRISGHSKNIFASDRFAYDLFHHTDLSRTDDYNRLKGKSGDTELSDIYWENYDLVVIDESHNFRNDKPGRKSFLDPITGENTHKWSRYEQLLNSILLKGRKTKVLMLSATPINNTLRDLRNQIYLLTEKRKDHFKNTLGINDIEQTFRIGEKKFNEWSNEEGPKDKADLCERLGGDIFALLDAITCARSRKQLNNYYASEVKKLGGFPKRNLPQNENPGTDTHKEIDYAKIYKLISSLMLSIYKPSSYFADKTTNLYHKLEAEGGIKQSDREESLTGMFIVTFMKRLESSVEAFRITLDKIIKKSEDLIDRIDKYKKETNKKQSTEEHDFEEYEEEDDEFVIGKLQIKIPFNELDLDRWREHIRKDKDILKNIFNKLQQIDTSRDAKLIQLKDSIVKKINNPTYDKKNKECRKLLIFTAYADTAKYLYNNLCRDIVNNTHVGLVTGTECKSTTSRDKDFNSILDQFAPDGRGVSSDQTPQEEIDILIATDCISEGQNLPDCDTVINYDIHWNPVRLIQRFGRIDRIGSKHKNITMVNYWPTQDLELYLKLEKRVRSKMVLSDITASTDNDLLSDKEEAEINNKTIEMRNKQLKRMFNQEIDFDEPEDEEVSILDFSLDSFIAELMGYLKSNQQRLEESPNGLYAVTDRKGRLAKYQPGTLFCFKISGLIKEKKQHGGSIKANQIYPYLLVYVTNNNEIKYKYTSTNNLLKALSDLTMNKLTPDNELYDIFNNETQHGKNLNGQEVLLKSALDSIKQETQIREEDGMRAGMGRDMIFTVKTEYSQKSHYKLITWLIIY